MPSQLDIANQALAHLATGRTIAAMNEATQAARVVGQFYPQARDEALRAFDWPFATTFAALTLVAGPSPRAAVDFVYSYRYPSDCVRARRLRITPRRPDVRAARVPFVVTQDGSGRLLLTDAAPVAASGDWPAFPQLEYTSAIAEAFWPSDFAAGVAHLLAWYAAPLLTGGDPHKLGLRSFSEAGRILGLAFQSSWNEREEDVDEPESQFLDARN